MFNDRTTKGFLRRFVSAKTTTPIPTRHPALQDALIQMSLDPSVRSISHLKSARVASESVDLDAIVVQRDDRRFLLDVVPARRIRDLEDEGLSLIALAERDLEPWVITAEDLRREPRYSNARLVWSYNGVRVPIELRMRILQATNDQQPVPIGQLLQRIQADNDPSSAVLALVCADLLELDLESQPIGPTTIVRSRTDARHLPSP